MAESRWPVEPRVARVAGMVSNMAQPPDREGPDSEYMLVHLPQLEEDMRVTLHREGLKTGATAVVSRRVALGVGAAMVGGDPLEVATPSTPLATEEDFRTFAEDAMPDAKPRTKTHFVGPTWLALRRAAAVIRMARDMVRVERVVPSSEDVTLGGKSYTREELKRIARLPLRFVLPPDADNTAEPSLDVDSLYYTLNALLPDGYKHSAGFFWQLSANRMDLLARFANHRLPDRPTLPLQPQDT